MKIKGKEAFLDQIGALPQAIRDEVRRALTVSAEETTDLMRRFAPVESGRLRASIGYRFGDPPTSTGFLADTTAAGQARSAKGEAGLAVTMYAGGHPTTKDIRKGSGEDYDYALAQEFGRVGQPANPFFFPGYRFGRKRARARLSRAIRAGAKKAFGK